jgi:hypothetical protein
MSTEDEIYFKARITDEIEDALRQLQTELQIDRSEAGRELMRRGAKLNVTPVVIRPNWTDKDLVALGSLREAAHKTYLAAKELRPLVERDSGNQMELRTKIAEVANQVYAEYVDIRNLRDALTGLSPEAALNIRRTMPGLRIQAEGGDDRAQALATLLEHLGF